MTYTYAILEVSQATFDDVLKRMRDAGSGHAFERGYGRDVIDMHGVALAVEPPTKNPLPPPLCAGPQGHYWLHKPLLGGGSRERCDYCGIPKDVDGG